MKYMPGKKGDFLNAYNSLKEIMVPGMKHTIDNKTFTVKNESILNGKSTYGVEIKAKNSVREANIIFHGPNTTNECTIQVTKAKKMEGKFVKIVTEAFLKRLITDFITGKGWADLKSDKCSFPCKECSKTYSSEKSLNVHMTKLHNNDKELMCSLCKTVYKTKVTSSRHLEKYHAKSNPQIKTGGKTRIITATKNLESKKPEILIPVEKHEEVKISPKQKTS